MENVEKDVVLDEVFKQRIEESKYFSEDEIKDINENIALFQKCYVLGMLDITYYSDN